MENGVFLPILTHALYGYFNLIVIAEMCYQGLVISIGGLNTMIFIYTTILVWSARRFDEKWGLKKWEVTSISVLPFATVFGIISFCM